MYLFTREEDKFHLYDMYREKWVNMSISADVFKAYTIDLIVVKCGIVYSQIHFYAVIYIQLKCLLLIV